MKSSLVSASTARNLQRLVLGMFVSASVALAGCEGQSVEPSGAAGGIDVGVALDGGCDAHAADAGATPDASGPDTGTTAPKLADAAPGADPDGGGAGTADAPVAPPDGAVHTDDAGPPPDVTKPEDGAADPGPASPDSSDVVGSDGGFVPDSGGFKPGDGFSFGGDGGGFSLDGFTMGDGQAEDPAIKCCFGKCAVPTIVSCVCAKVPACCTNWDIKCGMAITKNGCGSCPAFGN
ncbi:MAG: hypothetical protein EXR79_02330 [Myxococcales bacterium]|nr:hypothetical protein [Myxococcales bacterium]